MPPAADRDKSSIRPRLFWPGPFEGPASAMPSRQGTGLSIGVRFLPFAGIKAPHAGRPSTGGGQRHGFAQECRQEIFPLVGHFPRRFPPAGSPDACQGREFAAFDRLHVGAAWVSSGAVRVTHRNLPKCGSRRPRCMLPPARRSRTSWFGERLAVPSFHGRRATADQARAQSPIPLKADLGGDFSKSGRAPPHFVERSVAAHLESPAVKPAGVTGHFFNACPLSLFPKNCPRIPKVMMVQDPARLDPEAAQIMPLRVGLYPRGTVTSAARPPRRPDLFHVAVSLTNDQQDCANFFTHEPSALSTEIVIN